MTFPQAKVSLFVLAGQSNMTGRGEAANLSDELRRPRPDIPYFYDVWFARDGQELPSRSEGVPLQPTPRRSSTEGSHFGPELTFGRVMRQHVGDSQVGIVKLAHGGTNLAHDWNPAATGGHRLFARLMTMVRMAIEQLENGGAAVQLMGICWAQGEGDAVRSDTAEAYEAHLTELIHATRRQFGAPELPFVIAEAVPRRIRGLKVPSHFVPDAQQRVVRKLRGVSFVPTSDLSLLADGLHLNERGLLTLGERLADSMIEQLQEAIAL